MLELVFAEKELMLLLNKVCHQLKNSNQIENRETIDELEPIPKVAIASGSVFNNSYEIPIKIRGRLAY